MLEPFDIDASIATLDAALYAYSENPTSLTHDAVVLAFTPIADYYTQLTTISNSLQPVLSTSSQTVVTSLSASSERYNARIHPEETTLSREVMLGVFPSLRVESLPYLLSASVFMALLAIFIMFQMGGVTGQLNLPPAVAAWWSSPSSGVPIYKNPMVLAGSLMVVSVTLAVFIVKYYKAKR